MTAKIKMRKVIVADNKADITDIIMYWIMLSNDPLVFNACWLIRTPSMSHYGGGDVS